MDVARQLWSDNPPQSLDYFDPDRLSRLYSTGFVTAYKAAQKNPVFGLEEGESEGNPFDYDVVANSQDGCPLEDIKAEKTGEAAGGVTVTVTFKLWRCVEDAAERDALSEVRFLLIEENGKQVIDDIVRVMDGEQLSLLEEMQYIASGEADVGEDAPAIPLDEAENEE
ncbi:MAG TPA: hypothetical protein VLQ68_00295 [Rhizobiaceae bacterium]|nr:hypothetical protein [Rhizobiaceae bacterium]